jgi:peptidoglycan/xylan/chitin deacetylase (PgdA/CDA1 family)
MIRRRPVSLMYHGFSAGPRDDDPYDLFVSDTALDAQLTWLRDKGWRPLDLDAYLATWDRGRAGSDYLVTIDDGFTSVATVGAPVLARHGVASVLFVPPALLGATTHYLDQTPDEAILDADALRALPAQGVEIGVHGLDHTSMLGLSDAELETQTRGAREALADVTGVLPRSFAYPFGDFDPRAVRAVERAGYDVGFSVYSDAGRHAISRVDVKPGDTLAALRVKLVPGYRRIWRAAGAVKPLRRALRSVAWRR